MTDEDAGVSEVMVENNAQEYVEGQGVTLSQDSIVPECCVTKVRLYRRGKTGVQATAWVRFFGVIDVQFRILNGATGTFVVGPNGEHRRPDGRRRFFRRFSIIDEEIREQVESMILDAYRQVLKDLGRREPPPTPDDYDDYDLD